MELSGGIGRLSVVDSHTEGPWRWEFNAQNKIVHLVGGRPQFDLTIMDFSRWGMHRAGINLRDVAHNGMNLMHKLHERPDWIAPFPGREHHKHWCANVVHPDMRLIAAAPTLLSVVQKFVAFAKDRRDELGTLSPEMEALDEFARQAIAEATT